MTLYCENIEETTSAGIGKQWRRNARQEENEKELNCLVLRRRVGEEGGEVKQSNQKKVPALN